ncbi:YgaP family membrane protein [Chthonobacter rhizosphaerae]|uniref:YgaP family membrane protein n=1 Tax=Chthonobacter rhizosphaerae TaxID=2735553 RepID=UPI0015EE3DD1|nr:DUF2892 domain-containing protein [Chthonobacter rhizosphaerae]
MFATNMGSADRLFRAVLGVLLLAFAFTGVPETGFNWIGWIGVVPLATAAIGWCPLYVPFGIRTCRSA